MRTKRHVVALVGIPLLAVIIVLSVRVARLLAAGKVPVLDCPEELQLGERDRGEIVVCRFQVRNSGQALLTLDQFQTSCSCAGVERVVEDHYVSVRQVELGPREELELVARMAIGAPQGEPQVVSVYFRTNDPSRPLHRILLIVPRVKGGVYTLPKAVIFGSIPVGESAVRVLELYDTGMSGRKVAAARSKQPDRFDVRFVPLRPDEPAVAHPSAGNLIGRLEVTAHTERHGQLDGEIEIVLADEDRAPDIIPVVGDALARVQYRPQKLFLPRCVAKKYVYEGEVLLAARDGKAIQATIESASPGLSISMQSIPGRADQALVLVKFDSSAAGRLKSTIDCRVRVRIRTDETETVEDLPIIIGEMPS